MMESLLLNEESGLSVSDYKSSDVGDNEENEDFEVEVEKYKYS